MPGAASPYRVVLDWGTTSFRARLVDRGGAILDAIASPNGISGLAKEDFPKVLAREIAPWREAHGPLAIYAAGMIGSRNGWVEMPYLACPADAAALASATRRLDLAGGDTITFIPGLTDAAATPFPDVMRGEEVQLVGLGLDRDRIAILPGTHCKWARIESGRITRFQTFVTGEIFGVLARHSFIAGMIGDAKAGAPGPAFARGLAIALDADMRPTGLLSRLFSVRTGWLAGEVAAEDAADLLSGLVIGTEFVEARAAGWFAGGEEAVLIGDQGLLARYRLAAETAGLRPETGPEEAAVAGILAVAALAERR